MRPPLNPRKEGKLNHYAHVLNKCLLDCHVRKIKSDPYYSSQDRRIIDRPAATEMPNLVGYTHDGKFLAIHLVSTSTAPVRAPVLRFLRGAYKRSPHVGIAVTLSDCFDIVRGDSKRNKYTLKFLKGEIDGNDE